MSFFRWEILQVLLNLMQKFKSGHSSSVYSALLQLFITLHIYDTIMLLTAWEHIAIISNPEKQSS